MLSQSIHAGVSCIVINNIYVVGEIETHFGLGENESKFCLQHNVHI